MKKTLFIILLTILFTGLTYSKPQRQDYPEYQWDHNRLRNFTPTEHFTQEQIDHVSDIFNGINYHEFYINEDLGDVTSKLIFGRTTGGNGEISYDGTFIFTNQPIINNQALWFNESGVRPWAITATGGHLSFLSGDNLGSFLLNATAAVGTEKLRVNGSQYNDGTASLDALILREKSADPADPAEGQSVIWQADGTGAGDDGDLMAKITAGGVTKTTTLIDFSGI